MSLAVKNSELEILVVEDDEGFRKVLERVLRRAGYNVQTAENGKAALGLVETQKPRLVIVASVHTSRRTQYRVQSMPWLRRLDLAIAKTSRYKVLQPNVSDASVPREASQQQ